MIIMPLHGIAGDEEGYRPTLSTGDTLLAARFMLWCDQHGVGFDYDADETSVSIVTQWITDPATAVMLKITFGGSI